MKLKKITLIEPPQPQVLLGIGEMDNIMGGIVCDTYTLCNDSMNSSCSSFSNGKTSYCGDDKDISHVLCSAHSATCSSYESATTCSTFKF